MLIELLLLLGSYNNADQESIQLYSFNQETGQFSYVSGAKGVTNPTFLCTNAAQDIIYAVGEYDEDEKATMNALRLDKEQRTLSLFCTQLNGSGAPCNITLTPDGRQLVSANYTGGSVTFYDLQANGSLSAPTKLQYEGHGANPDRQEKPHLHAINFTPDQKYLLANDLGQDCIHVYPMTETGADTAHGYDLKVDAGAGPRHLCFAPNGRYAYLITELSGQIYTLSYENEKLSVVSSLVADTVQAGGSADIHLTSDGQYLYASHRLKGDGISIYKVNTTDGSLTRIGYQATGIHPRNFCITPNDKYLLVACRDGNAIQIFERDTNTGLLKDTGRSIEMPRPMFVKPIGY